MGNHHVLHGVSHVDNIHQIHLLEGAHTKFRLTHLPQHQLQTYILPILDIIHYQLDAHIFIL